MTISNRYAAVAAGALLASLAAGAAQGQDKPMSKAEEQKLIKDAMRAAPKRVAEKASIATLAKDGTMRAIREGSNGFTCMPDNPATPGPDPMCMDKNAQEWVMAWVQKKQPASGKVGLVYMLEGGTDASNTDPYATKPMPNNNWIKTGPHVMIVGADQAFYDMYPREAKPDTAAPYVMWPGTPYNHLMVPVK